MTKAEIQKEFMGIDGINEAKKVSTKLTPSSKVNNIFYSSKISLTFQGNNSSISLFSA